MTALTNELFAQREGAPPQQISQQLGFGRAHAACRYQRRSTAADRRAG